MSKSSSPTLMEIQTWMKSILTNPRGVQDALVESNHWIDFINSNEAPKHSRLDIYAEAYFARILEAFTIDFPLTSFVLGEDQFAKLVAEYLKVYPSTDSNLNNVSKSIINFISTYSHSQVIHDIVALERLALESFYSPIDPVFDPQSLAALKESDWENIKFNLNSSLKFLSSSWPLEELWNNRHEMQNATSVESEIQNYYFIERISNHINLLKVSETQFLILKKISKGELLSSFGEDILSSSEEDISVIFAQWVQKSYFKNYYF